MHRHREEMLYLFHTLADTGAKVILNLHPRSDRNWYQPLANAAGLPISDERIYALLPACDILITSYSSTVAPALALCKPTVVIDFIGLEYPVYDQAPGALILRDKKYFVDQLQSLLHEQDRYDVFVQAQKEQGGSWAMLDGKNTERVLKVAEELMQTM
jgi:CDP-glycerol glycerophosphotransferase (TagB/SpsB family)